MSLDLLASGYPSLDRINGVRELPRAGETASITDFGGRMHPGGCGINVAVGLSRLGFATGAACVMGDDEAGRELREHLEAEGVDLGAARTLPNERTSRSYLFVDREGTVQNYFYPGAAGTEEGGRIAGPLPETRWGLITVGPPSHNRAFLEQLRGRGIPIAVQLRAHAEAYRPILDVVVREARLLLMNEIELDFVVRHLGCTSGTELLGASAAEAVVVTRGKRGVRAWCGEETLEVGAVGPRELVDETGAGDGFCAGLMAGVLWDWPLRRCLRLGVLVSSFVLEKRGAQSNLPGPDTLRGRAKEEGDEELVKALDQQRPGES